MRRNDGNPSFLIFYDWIKVSEDFFPAMKKKPIDKAQCQDTGLAAILILLIAFSVTQRTIFVGLAMAATLFTMTAPLLLKPAARFWFGLSHVMGEVVSRVLMTVVFLCIATPIGLLRRCTGKDAMRLKAWKTGRGSVFVDRNHTMTARDIEKPF